MTDMKFIITKANSDAGGKNINEIYDTYIIGDGEKTKTELSDNLIFIDHKIFEDSLLVNFLSNSFDNSLIIICNALLAGILIYYCFSHLLSHITYFKTQPFYFFIFRN